MNPACTARGIRRWCARWASWIVFARLSSWSSLRRSRGRFLRKSRAIAPRLGAPGAPVALDRRERGLGPLRPLTFQELGDGQPRELGGEMAQSAAVASAVARHGEGRRGPEDPLDDPALRADDGAVGQE